MSRSRTSLLILAFLMATSNPARADDMVIVCHGDSITRGAHLPPDETYPKVVAGLMPDTTVINAGVGGNTSQAGLKRLAADVLSHEPDFVVLLFGTNDSVLTGPNAYRVPVDRYEQNLRDMIDRCRKSGAQVVLCTLLPINAEPYFTRHPKPPYDLQGGLESILHRYRAAALRVGKTTKTPVVDLYTAFEKDESLLRPAPDGVHPTADGAAVIASAVVEIITRSVSEGP